jgi:hypothetical protein
MNINGYPEDHVSGLTHQGLQVHVGLGGHAEPTINSKHQLLEEHPPELQKKAPKYHAPQ